MPPIITTANSNYRIQNVDIANNVNAIDGPGFVSYDYLIDVYPSIYGNLTTAGLWVWGIGGDGLIGSGIAGDSWSPTQTIAGGYNWSSIESNATDSLLAIKTDGTLWAWGGNNKGKLGDGTESNKSSPVQTIDGGSDWQSASIGFRHAAGIKNNGTLWTWGDNTWGQLGTNNTTHRSSPAQSVSTATDWKQVKCGTYHSIAVRLDGTLWTWGHNARGQLGDNTILHRSSPVQTAAGGANWRLVAAGSYHNAAIKDDGSLWTWGRNNNGQLGDNTTASRSSPVETISGGNDWKLVACGDYHTVAIKLDGTLWGWGEGSYGRLGNNNTASRSSPVQTVSGGNNWKIVACGAYHTAAIKTDGSLWNWGRGGNGQLGTGINTSRSSPVQTLDGGNNWKRVTCAYSATAAIRDASDI